MRNPKDKITHFFKSNYNKKKKFKYNYLRGQMHQNKTTEHKVYPFEISWKKNRALFSQ